MHGIEEKQMKESRQPERLSLRIRKVEGMNKKLRGENEVPGRGWLPFYDIELK